MSLALVSRPGEGGKDDRGDAPTCAWSWTLRLLDREAIRASVRPVSPKPRDRRRQRSDAVPASPRRHRHDRRPPERRTRFEHGESNRNSEIARDDEVDCAFRTSLSLAPTEHFEGRLIALARAGHSTTSPSAQLLVPMSVCHDKSPDYPLRRAPALGSEWRLRVRPTTPEGLCPLHSPTVTVPGGPAGAGLG